MKKSFFDQLNLRPFERRLVVVIVAVMFIVLQVMFIWPHFSDLAKVQLEIVKAEKVLDTYQKKASKLKSLQQREAALKGQSAEVATGAQAIELLKTAQTQAARSGINVQGYIPSNARAVKGNDFFEESTLTINFQNTGDKELLDFLVTIGGENSLIRVRDLNLRPEQNQMRLAGTLTLVASYQKAPVKSAATNLKRP